MSTAYAVTGVLDRRQRELESRLLGRCVVAAAVLHLAGAGAAWFVPRWTKQPPPPIEYVAVQIVPAARLGIEKPPPPKPEPAKPEPVPPKPEPKQEAPVLPKPEAKPKPQPAPPKPEPAKAEPEPEVQPEGSVRGTVSGLALGASVAGLDNPDFTYGYYVDQMLKLIQTNWVRPMVGSGVETTIFYRIARDGRIIECRIELSSGINSFDLAALRAVQSSTPLPPLPRAFRDSWLGVHLIFR